MNVHFNILLLLVLHLCFTLTERLSGWCMVFCGKFVVVAPNIRNSDKREKIAQNNKLEFPEKANKFRIRTKQKRHRKINEKTIRRYHHRHNKILEAKQHRTMNVAQKSLTADSLPKRPFDLCSSSMSFHLLHLHFAVAVAVAADPSIHFICTKWNWYVLRIYEIK